MVAALGLLVMLSACAEDYPTPTADSPGPESDPSATTPTPPVESIALDAWNSVRPGRDGALPVTVRWTHQLSIPENFYVVDDVVYVSDECLITLSLFSGEELWRACKPSGDGIYTDGGDEIGPAGPGRIRLWTWYNETLLIDTESHRVIESRPAGGNRPPGFVPFPAGLDRTYDFSGRQARNRRGQVAWSIRTIEPLQIPLGPVRTPSGGIVVTSSGLMVSLDYAR